MENLISIANARYDGHFTLMKFTTNWRCCFGTIWDSLQGTVFMSEGKTMQEAIDNCIDGDINYIDIADQEEKAREIMIKPFINNI
ncbi:hypothetical protein LGK95_15000 [Clostridium algoriphilum]|uniref:hypothetical protein n=1 Tax=Clostridium algoriphilum TaxID=198347 RepID=UPI001CF20131|nr:hypothetical protein [Clostridium algoriphilum]MCB2294806.1 hypothetical protein [Clostridium algoriphilum]